MKPLAIAALALFFAFGPAHANSVDLWSSKGEPSAYDRAMTEADDLVLRALRGARRGARSQARRLARDAVAAYERASHIDAKQAEPHYRAAEVIYGFMIDEYQFPNRSDLQAAVRHWEAFEKLSPLDPRLEPALFRRSLAHTKLGGEANFLRAIADYDRELELIDQSSIRHRGDHLSTIFSNRAEILMAVGRLDDAIEGYERSIAYRDRSLYGYGLAVALDRDGQAQRARRIMRIYASSDPTDALADDGVFFVPKGEAFYYYALRAEALGQKREAIAHYNNFLASLPHSRWAKRAEQNLRALKERHRSR
jgi:tetratricopeptide (TPR) repeat protein